MSDPSHEFRSTGDAAHQAADTASDTAAGLRNEAREALEKGAETTRDRLADGIDHAAEAARNAARHLEHDETWAAGLIGQAADGLADFADTLRRNDLRTLLDRAENIARQQPVLFTGASMVLGFALVRAARAATTAPTATSMEAPHGR